MFRPIAFILPLLIALFVFNGFTGLGVLPMNPAKKEGFTARSSAWSRIRALS